MIALRLAIAACGAVVGSFVATAVVRAQGGRIAWAGPSRCDGCGRALGPLETLPLVAYPLLRGRCRTCQMRIDPLHIAGELGGLTIGAITACLAGQAPSILLAAGFVVAQTLLALTLHLTRRARPTIHDRSSRQSMGAAPWRRDVPWRR